MTIPAGRHVGRLIVAGQAFDKNDVNNEKGFYNTTWVITQGELEGQRLFKRLYIHTEGCAEISIQMLRTAGVVFDGCGVPSLKDVVDVQLVTGIDTYSKNGEENVRSDLKFVNNLNTTGFGAKPMTATEKTSFASSVSQYFGGGSSSVNSEPPSLTPPK